MLAIFRSLGIEKLDLSFSLAADPLNAGPEKASRVLRVLRMPHSFRDVWSLCLRSVPLRDQDISYLSELKSLAKLDLAGTGITSEAIARLVVHKTNLTQLDLSHNPAIRHESAFTVGGGP